MAFSNLSLLDQNMLEFEKIVLRKVTVSGAEADIDHLLEDEAEL